MFLNFTSTEVSPAPLPAIPGQNNGAAKGNDCCIGLRVNMWHLINIEFNVLM